MLRGAASVAVGLGSVGAGSATPGWSFGPRAQASPGAADWRALAQELRGVLVRPGASRYAQAVRTFDPRRDGATPRAVIQVAGEADVVTTLAFVQRFGRELGARSCGHSYGGASTGNGVVVLDTGALRSVPLASAAGRVRIGPGVRL